MRLSDLGIVTIEQLKALAKLAPKEEKDTASGLDRGKKSRQRRSPGADLGRMDIEAYLRHYGIEYNVKRGHGKTFYRLSQCLFDPSHTKNEASIVQDDQGLLTYQCFHNSCRDHKWKEARELISGSKSLAEYCEGYDPARKSPPQSASFQVALGDPEKPFLKLEEKKKRPDFKAAWMAEYLIKKYEPVLCEGKDFGKMMFRYNPDLGVWEFFPEAEVLYESTRLLGEWADGQKEDKVLKVFQNKIYQHPDSIKRYPHMLNLRNTMLNVETMEFVPHNAKYNSRAQMPVRYLEGAKCERWILALKEIFADDLTKISILQQFFGYCLYPGILFPAALFQIGPGGNGKGTVEHVLTHMLGQMNVSNISLKRMEKPFGPIEIRDKLLNACAETATEALETTQFKQIAAGDRVQAEQKYMKDATFYPIAKHLISMNDFPGIKDKTDSFFRRIIVLEYAQSFEGENQEPRLRYRLVEEELDGIFLWALDGLKVVLKKEEIVTSKSVDAGKTRFRERADPWVLYAGERLDWGEIFDQPRTDVWNDWGQWLAGSNLKSRLGKQRFYDRFAEKGIKTRRIGTKECFVGIRLRPE